MERSVSTSTWLSDVCGDVEAQLVSHMHYDRSSHDGILTTTTQTFAAGKFDCYPLDELLYDANLNIRLMKLKGLIYDSDYPHIMVTCGVDVGAAILAAKKDAIFQVASQFNCLEMPHPGISSDAGISNYLSDNTQGPRAVLACTPGLLVRNTYYSDTNLLETLGISCKNGYLLWGNEPEKILSLLQLNSHKIHIGVMENTVVAGITKRKEGWIPHHQDKTITQVFTAAAPVNCYGNSGDIDVQLNIAKILIHSQYLALIAYAIKNVTSEKDIVPVHLTLLGTGVFGVPLDLVIECLTSALLHFSFPIPVIIHCYHSDSSIHLRGLEWDRWRIILDEQADVKYHLRKHQLIILNELLKLSISDDMNTPKDLRYHNITEDIDAHLYCQGKDMWYVNNNGQRRTVFYH